MGHAAFHDRRRGPDRRLHAGGDARRPHGRRGAPRRRARAACGVAPSTASEHLARLVEGRAARRSSRAAASGATGSPRSRWPRCSKRSPASARRLPSPRCARPAGARRCGPRARVTTTSPEGSASRSPRRSSSGMCSAPRNGSFELTDDGEAFLEDLGVDVAGARARKRVFARACLDWSERRPHLAGALGAALADAALAQQLGAPPPERPRAPRHARRCEGVPRAARVT